MSLHRLDPPLCTPQNCLKPKFPVSAWGGGGGEVVSQHLMLSPKLPKTQIPYVCWGVGVVLDYVRHLVKIWGELLNLDKNFVPLRESQSWMVSCGD